MQITTYPTLTPNEFQRLIVEEMCGQSDAKKIAAWKEHVAKIMPRNIDLAIVKLPGGPVATQYMLVEETSNGCFSMPFGAESSSDWTNSNLNYILTKSYTFIKYNL